jgi:hypothetical protein
VTEPPSPSTNRDELVRRARVLGFTGAGVCFLVSQIGLLWVLATGGIGPAPSVAATVWLLSSLVMVLFVFVVADSYRTNPRWILQHAPAAVTDGDGSATPRHAPARFL